MHQISAVENPAHRADDFYDEKLDPQDQWYDDLEGIGDPPDASKMVDDQSDISDYEDQLKGRKRKKRDSVKVGVLCLQHCTVLSALLLILLAFRFLVPPDFVLLVPASVLSSVLLHCA